MNEHLGSKTVADDLQAKATGGSITGTSKKQLANQRAGVWVRDVEKEARETGKTMRSVIGVEYAEEGK